MTNKFDELRKKIANNAVITGLVGASTLFSGQALANNSNADFADNSSDNTTNVIDAYKIKSQGKFNNNVTVFEDFDSDKNSNLAIITYDLSNDYKVVNTTQSINGIEENSINLIAPDGQEVDVREVTTLADGFYKPKNNEEHTQSHAEINTHIEQNFDVEHIDAIKEYVEILKDYSTKTTHKATINYVDVVNKIYTR